jgi:small-conductance mechanosensitive channel
MNAQSPPTPESQEMATPNEGAALKPATKPDLTPNARIQVLWHTHSRSVRTGSRLFATISLPIAVVLACQSVSVRAHFSPPTSPGTCGPTLPSLCKGQTVTADARQFLATILGAATILFVVIVSGLVIGNSGARKIRKQLVFWDASVKADLEKNLKEVPRAVERLTRPPSEPIWPRSNHWKDHVATYTRLSPPGTAASIQIATVLSVLEDKLQRFPGGGVDIDLKALTRQFVWFVRKCHLRSAAGASYFFGIGLVSGIYSSIANKMNRPPTLLWETGRSFAGILAWVSTLAALSLIVGVFAKHVVTWWSRTSPTDLDDVFGGVARVLGTISFWAAGWIFVVKAQAMNSYFTTSFTTLTSQENPVREEPLIVLFMLLTLCYLSVVVFNKVILVALSRVAQRTKQTYDDAFVFILRCYGTFATVALSGAVVLLVFSRPVERVLNISHILIPYAVLVSTVTALIGLATQETAANFISGLMLQIDRPFVNGDRIRLENGTISSVKEVGVRATKLIDIFEDTQISIPNRDLANSAIVNIAQPSRALRIEIVVTTKPELIQEDSEILLALAHVNQHTSHPEIKLQMTDLLTDKNFPNLTDRSKLDCLRKTLEKFSVTITESRKSFDLNTARKHANLRHGHFETALAQFVEIFDSNKQGDLHDTSAPPAFHENESVRTTSEQLSREPVVVSEYSTDQNGHEIVTLRLRLFAVHYQLRDAVVQRINIDFAKHRSRVGGS